MAGNPSSWFFLWVPSRVAERDKRSSSTARTRCSDILPGPRGRSCSQGRSSTRERSCSADSLHSGHEDPGTSFAFTETSSGANNSNRPVLKSLPAIQEDQDYLLISNGRLTVTSVSEQGESPGTLRHHSDTGEDALSTCTSTTSTSATTPVEAASNRRGSAVKEEDSTASDKEQDKLAKQESYDSHVKRGGGGGGGGDTTTPLTPHTPHTFPDDSMLSHGEGDESALAGGENVGDSYCEEEEEEEEMEATVLDAAEASTRGADHTTTSTNSMSFVERECMEDLCRDLLTNMSIAPVTIQYSNDNRQVLFTFSVPYDLVETVLLQLQNKGIGQTENTSVSVVPSSIHYSSLPPPRGASMLSKASQDDKMDSFYSSVKSRLLVAEVIARIQAGAEFSFDFLLLLLLAGAIAFMGLLENSSVVLVASMLVSPLMGPILAGIFGGVVQDSSLTWKGVRHETKALLICIALGFCFGLLVSPFPREYGCLQWPTQEMLSRGQLRALWVGVLIAMPSGAGVALSVLGGNAGSLVGVAISASLLPPAVNAGTFWALSAVLAMTGSKSTAFYGFGEEIDLQTNETISLYQPSYYDNLALEAFCLGLTSLMLTLLNILCIILTGVLILRLKEVTPEKIPQKFSNFWRRDVKAHRNYYKTCKEGDNQKLLNELHALGFSQPSEGLAGTFLHNMFERAAHDTDLIDIKQWVTQPPASYAPAEIRRSRRNSTRQRQQLRSRSMGPGHASQTLVDFSDETKDRRKRQYDKAYMTIHPSMPQSNPTFVDFPEFFNREITIRSNSHSKTIGGKGRMGEPV